MHAHVTPGELLVVCEERAEAARSRRPRGSGPQSGGWHHLDGCASEFCGPCAAAHLVFATADPEEVQRPVDVG